MEASSSARRYAPLLIAPGGPDVKVKFQFLDPITESEYQSVNDAENEIKAYLGENLSSYVRNSLEQFLGVGRQIRRLIAANSIPAIAASVESWRRTVVCGALTFCSALHLFYEQTINRLRKLYGKESAEVKRAKELFSVAYDASLAYRLTYRLRNVLVHHSLNSVSIELSSDEQTSPSGLILHRHTVRFPLLREEFLKTKAGVSAELREEIRSLPGDPDLLDLFPEAFQSLMGVQNQLLDLMAPNLERSIRIIVWFDRLFGNRVGQRAIGELPDVVVPGFLLAHRVINEEVLAFARAAADSDNATE